MYKFNATRFYLEEIDEDFFCLFNTACGDVYVINETSRYLLNALQATSDIETIVNTFVLEKKVDLEKASKSQIISEFHQIKKDFILNEIILEVDDAEV